MAIFGPPFMPYPHFVLALFSMLLMITTYRGLSKTVMLSSGSYRWLLAMLIWASYTVIVGLGVSLFVGDIVNTGHYISIFNRYGMLIVVSIPTTTCLLCYGYLKGYDYHFYIETIVHAGLIEGFCAIAAFLSPTIKSFFISLMARFGDSTLYSNTWYITVRSYGFASGLVDLFGLGIAIIAGISFFYGCFEKRRYIIYSLIISVAALLNARTGVVLYALALIIGLVYLIRTGRIKGIFRVFVFLLIVYLIIREGLQFVDKSSATFGWLQQGFEGIASFLKTKSIGSEDTTNPLYSLMNTQSWILPNIFRTIIGTGHTLYQAEGYKHSDIGYINEIWLSGVIGCVWLYGNIIKVAIKYWKNKTPLIRLSCVYILICYFVFNIKGAALGYNAGAMAMMMFLFIFNFCSIQEEYY